MFISLEVVKVADTHLIPPEGQDVTFTFTVTNTSEVPVEITSLEDDVFGTLSGDADCQVGTILPPGGSCVFEETFFVASDVAPNGDPESGVPAACEHHDCMRDPACRGRGHGRDPGGGAGTAGLRQRPGDHRIHHGRWRCRWRCGLAVAVASYRTPPLRAGHKGHHRPAIRASRGLRWYSRP